MKKVNIMTAKETHAGMPQRFRLSPAELTLLDSLLVTHSHALSIAEQITTDATIEERQETEAHKDMVSGLHKRIKIGLMKAGLLGTATFAPTPKKVSTLEYLTNKIEQGESLTEEEELLLNKEIGL